MAKVKVSLNAGFKVIPEDTEISFTVFEAEIKQSEGKEFPYINWTLKVNSGEYEGNNIWVMTSLAPQASFFLEALLNCVGFEYTKDDEGCVEFDTDDVLTCTGQAITGIDTWKGKDKTVIRTFVNHG